MKPKLSQFARGAGLVLVVGAAIILVAPLAWGKPDVQSSVTGPAGHADSVRSHAAGTNQPSPVATPSASQQDLTAGVEGFIDLHKRSYAWLGTDPANTQLFGHFVFYVEGVGTFLPTGTATVNEAKWHRPRGQLRRCRLDRYRGQDGSRVRTLD